LISFSLKGLRSEQDVHLRWITKFLRYSSQLLMIEFFKDILGSQDLTCDLLIIELQF
jgi:hypothetical protein